MNPIAPTQFDDIDFERRFGGIARLYGERALERFRGARLRHRRRRRRLLDRRGAGAQRHRPLTLIDLDNVAESNINRQIQALSTTVGMPKIEALASASP
jgi:tRNA A37 threonylcarbamoyladenosine dehydratase